MRFAVLIVLAAALGLGACGTTGEPADDPRPLTRALTAEAAAPVPAGRTPVDVAVDGTSVWVLDQASGRLSRHDTTTGRRLGRGFRVGPSPFAVALGEDAVWVLDARAGVQRVNAASGRPVGPPVPVADPVGLAVGADTVWVTSRASRSVIPVDVATMRPGTPIKLRAAPGDIAFAAGAAWVAATDAGTVTRVDARARTADAPLRLAPGQVLALTAGNGAIYAAVAKTNLNDELELVRIDAGTGKVAGARVPITGGIPLRLAAGAGSVWVTDVGSSLTGSPAREPRLLRVDPEGSSADPVATIPGRPSSVAAGADAIWVTDSTRGELTRVAVR